MLNIDNEFRLLISKLADEEFTQLEKNILEDGIRDPIVLWGETIIDGHNRYTIATKHDLKYKTVKKEFDTRDKVLEWIILNQFGRRNLSAYERSILALRLKPIYEEKAKVNMYKGTNQFSPVANSPKPSVNTRDEISKLAGVGSNTISKGSKDRS